MISICDPRALDTLTGLCAELELPVSVVLHAHGTAVRKERAELLNLPPAQCTALLRRMADRGELLLTGKRYALPPQKKPLETN